MPAPNKFNEVFELAARFVNDTDRHVFLTGKAGTGKTTFLKYIRETSDKKMAVVAPTGVAAINAGGVTMHSFFQLPFGAFIPGLHFSQNGHLNINTPDTLFKNLRLSSERKRLLLELELLIIDEVSMLRADVLDEIDFILRHFRRQPLVPFGGVQMLYIGDLFQLPPVVNKEEWEILKNHYKSPFFFDAQVLQEYPPLVIELKKIYRQHEEDFIGILNNIRNNTATESDLNRLHLHYQPDYELPYNSNYIILTTHNAKADAINQQKLNMLRGKLYEFEAECKGDFNERAYPADKTLQLKSGAQVMFIKNDKGENRRYFNGKIALVERITETSVYISFPGEEDEMELEKETWKNIKYHYNRVQDKIEEEELGSFTQYPVRLAWAITIHKSQGLTFQKAVIDAGASFAAGQVYVALSRLTSLEGLILFSRIHPQAIQTDQRVLDFSRSELGANTLQDHLQQEQKGSGARSLLRYFEWTKITEALKEHYDAFDQRQMPDKSKAVIWARQLMGAVSQQQEMSVKFLKQLEQLLERSDKEGHELLRQRVSAASEYFSKGVRDCIADLQQHTRDFTLKLRAKKYLSSLKELNVLFQRKQHQLTEAVQVASSLQ